MIENEDDSLFIRRLPLLSHSIVKIEGVRIWLLLLFIVRSLPSFNTLSSTHVPLH